MTIGERVRSARRERGWTQTQLAKAAGLKQAEVSRCENGARLGADKVLPLADALGVDLRWLIAGTSGGIAA